MIAPRLIAAFGAWTDIWIRSGWRVQLRGVDARVIDPAGRMAFGGVAHDSLAWAVQAAPGAGAGRAAVLLHGLANTPGIMSRTEAALRDAGWAVANMGYPSLRGPVEAHGRAASLVARALAEDGAREIAFVGHSLGGLVARTAMNRADTDGWPAGRLVLIGSPARGSAMARMLRTLPGYMSLLGACGHAVTPAGAAGIPLPCGTGLAVIAGGTGRHGYNPLLSGDDDGLVTVDETRLPGHENGFLLVRSLHTPLASRPETVAATLAFLSHGRMAA